MTVAKLFSVAKLRRLNGPFVAPIDALLTGLEIWASLFSVNAEKRSAGLYGDTGGSVTRGHPDVGPTQVVQVGNGLKLERRCAVGPINIGVRSALHDARNVRPQHSVGFDCIRIRWVIDQAQLIRHKIRKID